MLAAIVDSVLSSSDGNVTFKLITFNDERGLPRRNEWQLIVDHLNQRVH